MQVETSSGGRAKSVLNAKVSRLFSHDRFMIGKKRKVDWIPLLSCSICYPPPLHLDDDDDNDDGPVSIDQISFRISRPAPIKIPPLPWLNFAEITSTLSLTRNRRRGAGWSHLCFAGYFIDLWVKGWWRGEGGESSGNFSLWFLRGVLTTVSEPEKIAELYNYPALHALYPPLIFVIIYAVGPGGL